MSWCEENVIIIEIFITILNEQLEVYGILNNFLTHQLYSVFNCFNSQVKQVNLLPVCDWLFYPTAATSLQKWISTKFRRSAWESSLFRLGRPAARATAASHAARIACRPRPGCPDRCKGRICKDRTCKDRTCKDRACKDRACKDKVCKDKVCKDRTFYLCSPAFPGKQWDNKCSPGRTVGRLDSLDKTSDNKFFLVRTADRQDFLGRTADRQDFLDRTADRQDFLGRTVDRLDFLARTADRRDFLVKV